jgi:serine/threonine protein kinase
MDAGHDDGAEQPRRWLRVDDELEIEAARAAIASSLFGSSSPPVKLIGRYALRRRLGAGGMGIVFEAHDPSLDRELAIKVLHPRNDGRESEELLLKEAQSAARLVHPAVVTVYDVGVHEGRVFIAMEKITGRSMEAWLPTRPAWRECVAVLARAARGLEAAHAAGIIHRDFKPANVLIGEDGRVCVADFGLAQEVAEVRFAPTSVVAPQGLPRALTRSGHIAGTPPYMAPEQYLGTRQDERTDQFAFCVSLYEAIFGRRPFLAATGAELRDAILTAQPALPVAHEIPNVLLNAISRGLGKSRRDRFATMGELAALLESLSAGIDLGQLLKPSSPPGDAEPSTRRPGGFAKPTYRSYLSGLPDGLRTAADQRLPSRIYQLILAHRPLENPPLELMAILATVSAEATIPAVHARAILSAVYDEHFESAQQWRAFLAEVSQGVVTLLLTSFTIPRPSSPSFIQGLMATYNNRAAGIRMDIVEAATGSATIRMTHPRGTLNDVSLVAWEEVIRAVMLGAGCRQVELDTVEKADDGFVLLAAWS